MPGVGEIRVDEGAVAGVGVVVCGKLVEERLQEPGGFR